ncbi:MAG: hypothetical protein PVF57_02055 [Pseudomonadales bacterium]|jgi:hypothetical protein
MKTIQYFLTVLVLYLSAPGANAFTALCAPGSPPSGQPGPSSNLLHISAWTTTEATLYTKASHDTIWFVGGFPVADWESGDFDPSGSTGYVSWILTQPYDPEFMTNLGETWMRFYTYGGGVIPPGWLNFNDTCEGSGVVF